jgi:hydroxymethylglutaryl-CoA reductase
MEAKVWDSDNGTHLLIPRWGVEEKIQKGADHKYSVYKSLDMIIEKLELQDRNMKIEVIPHVPRAMGLGGSAALAVAIIRALDKHFKLNLSDEDVNRFSYESEMLAHGNASGIDNTLATYGKFMLFKRGQPPELKELKIKKPIPIVIGLSGVESLTAKMVSIVRAAWENNESIYTRIFEEIDGLVLQAVEAIENHNLAQLGELMNINQGLLNALQVSSRELEELIEISRRNGALGAKLTGAGGGGAMVAICPEEAEKVAFALRKAGYKALVTEIG